MILKRENLCGPTPELQRGAQPCSRSVCMCLCYLSHLPVQQPRAGRFLAYGTAPVLQTSCSDPNKSANLSHLLPWADCSCTTATCLSRYSPSVLEDLSQGGIHIFSFAPGLSHLLSAYSSWEKYEVLSKDLLIPIQNANLSVLLHQCFATWDGSATSSTICHGLWGQTPHKANLKT